MAVYTDVSDNDVAELAKLYCLGDVLACKGIAEGVENSNFLLRTTAGQFILTLYEKRVNPDDLPFFLGLMEHLNARGISCPLPVKDTRGQMLNEVCGRPAALITFLAGLSVKRPSVAHCAQVGAELARFHAGGEDFAGKRANALSLDGWKALAAQVEGREDAVIAGLGADIKAALDDLSARWPSGLPRGVIHADLFTDNVFFIGSRLSGVIDFYFACNDFLSYDLAICLNAWCFEPDHSYNATKGRAMLDAYHAERPLTADEIAAFPLLCKGAALRFLLTRLVDWLNVPPGALVKPKDPAEYWKKLRFHNGVASFAGYGWEP
jgi:homoserine kinase type II